MVGKLISSIATGSFGVVQKNPGSPTALRPRRSERFITAPVCDQCWNRADVDPARLNPREAEQCAFCGDPTLSGIYVRVRASEVFYLPPAER